jgi:hypothetical protein
VHSDGLIALLVVQRALRALDLLDGDAPAALVEGLTQLETKGHVLSARGCTRRRYKPYSSAPFFDHDHARCKRACTSEDRA